MALASAAAAVTRCRYMHFGHRASFKHSSELEMGSAGGERFQNSQGALKRMHADELRTGRVFEGRQWHLRPPRRRACAPGGAARRRARAAAGRRGSCGNQAPPASRVAAAGPSASHSTSSCRGQKRTELSVFSGSSPLQNSDASGPVTKIVCKKKARNVKKRQLIRFPLHNFACR